MKLILHFSIINLFFEINFTLLVGQRFQVEYTVTKLITGINIVKAQIRIAVSEDHGAAIQCRLTAEEPRTRVSENL